MNLELKEVWKHVNGFKGVYEVSNLGRVRSKDHVVKTRTNGTRIQYGRVLKGSVSIKGYLRVALSSDCVKFNASVHRLVAISFIQNPENKPQVNHINGVKSDNRVDNLEWCTNSENQIHAVKNKLIKHNLGDKHHMSKLTNNEVIEARALFNSKKLKNTELAKKYNVSATAMSNILRKITYKEV